MRNKNKSGFTLIELLVVIAIIGLLASIVLLALNGARQKSRDATRLADVRQLASAFELFFNDAGAYPTGAAGYIGTAKTDTSVDVLGVSGLTATTANGTFNFTPGYIGTIPVAPTPFDNASGATCTAANNAFQYVTNNTGTTYTLSFCLGNVTGGYAAGVRTLTPGGIQ